MTAERTNDPALKRQLCPSCAQPMRLVRRTPRFGGLPELVTFECESCGLSHIGEDARPRKVSHQTNISAWYLDEFGNPTREIKVTRVAVLRKLSMPKNRCKDRAGPGVRQADYRGSEDFDQHEYVRARKIRPN
jgi:hypothetical protein